MSSSVDTNTYQILLIYGKTSWIVTLCVWKFVSIYISNYHDVGIYQVVAGGQWMLWMLCIPTVSKLREYHIFIRCYKKSSEIKFENNDKFSVIDECYKN